jgi:hypothetical protein
MRSIDKKLVFHVPHSQDIETVSRDLSGTTGVKCEVTLSRGEVQTVACSNEDVRQIEQQAELLGLRLINVIES